MVITAVTNVVAAYNLTGDAVKVEDVTVDKDNFFITVNAHTDNGEYEVAFDVWPNAHSIVGSFSAAEGTIGYSSSFVHKTKAGTSRVNRWYYPGKTNVIELTIVKKDDETCTLSGKMEAVSKDDGNTYTYVIAAFDFAYSDSGTGPDPQQDPYRFEPAEATHIDFEADVVAVKFRTGMLNFTLNEIANETYDWIEINLITDEYEWPAGTYSIDQSGDPLTLTASKGYLGMQNDDPCYVAIRKSDEGWGQYTPYYLESGTLTVSYNTKTDSIFITGSATSHNGTSVAIEVKSLNPLYVEGDEPKQPEQKTLAIDTVVVTYMREESDVEAHEHHYTFNFFYSEDDYPNVIADAILTEPLALVEGTYRLADGNLSDIVLFQSQADFNEFFFGGMPYEFTSASLTLSDAGNGKWTYAMNMTTSIGSEYDFTFTQAPHIINYPDPDGEEVDPKDQPFADEKKNKVTLNIKLDSIRWEDKTVSKDGILDIYLFQRNADAEGLRAAMQLGMYTPISAVSDGTYPINGSESNYTFSASVGRYGNVLFPCYLTLIDKDSWAHAIWYLVDGAISIAYAGDVNEETRDAKKYVISGEATSYFGSTITFRFESPATGVEEVSTREERISTRKVLENGTLYIIREGKRYTVTGEGL